jgi:hypothetical protein
MPALALLLAGCVLSLRAEDPLAAAARRGTLLAARELALREGSGVSRMPEGILEKLTPPQLRDPFAYLEKKQ